MIMVASYCRVSTDKDDQVNSFEAQKTYFKEYIAGKPDWELYNVYADEGITGTSTKKANPIQPDDQRCSRRKVQNHHYKRSQSFLQKYPRHHCIYQRTESPRSRCFIYE